MASAPVYKPDKLFFRNVHHITTIDALRDVNFEKGDDDDQEYSAEHCTDDNMRDCSKCKKNEAVCYCVSCGERYCSTDEAVGRLVEQSNAINCWLWSVSSLDF